MPFAARKTGNRNHDDLVQSDTVGMTRCFAALARAEPEIRDTKRDRGNALAFDCKPLTKELARKSAVGGDLGPRPEYACGSNCKPLERRLGFVDF